MRRDEELVDLIVFHDAEAFGIARCAYDPNMWKRGVKPVSKALQRPGARELRRHQMGMRLTPGVEPQSRQVIDLGGLGDSDVHF